MSELDLIIHGKTYRVACGDGEEDHLRRIATQFDERVKNLLRSIGKSHEKMNEAHLLVLASLLMADEMDELRNRLAIAEESLTHNHKTSPDSKSSQDHQTRSQFEQKMENALSEVAARLETLAVKLDQG